MKCMLPIAGASQVWSISGAAEQMNPALGEVPACPRRAGMECGGATVCRACLDWGVSRAARKLLRGSVAAAQLPSITSTVWPEASRHEVAAVADALVTRRVAIIMRRKGGGADTIAEHALWPFLRQFKRRAVEAADPVDYARLRSMFWLVPLITPARLQAAGLHVVEQPGTSHVLARQQTLLNATDSDRLAAAVQRRGLKGTPAARIFEEYDGAFDDLFALSAAGTLVLDEGLVWHTSVVGKAVPGALEMWRGAIGLYDGAPDAKK